MGGGKCPHQKIYRGKCPTVHRKHAGDMSGGKCPPIIIWGYIYFIAAHNSTYLLYAIYTITRVTLFKFNLQLQYSTYTQSYPSTILLLCNNIRT